MNLDKIPAALALEYLSHDIRDRKVRHPALFAVVIHTTFIDSDVDAIRPAVLPSHEIRYTVKLSITAYFA